MEPAVLGPGLLAASLPAGGSLIVQVAQIMALEMLFFVSVFLVLHLQHGSVETHASFL